MYRILSIFLLGFPIVSSFSQKIDVEFKTKTIFSDNEPIIIVAEIINESNDEAFWLTDYFVQTPDGFHVSKIDPDPDFRRIRTWEPDSLIPVVYDKTPSLLKTLPGKSYFFTHMINQCFGNACYMSDYYAMEVPFKLPAGDYEYCLAIRTYDQQKYFLKHHFSVVHNNDGFNTSEEWLKRYSAFYQIQDSIYKKGGGKFIYPTTIDNFIYQYLDTAQNSMLQNLSATKLKIYFNDKSMASSLIKSLRYIPDQNVMLYTLGKIVSRTDIRASEYLNEMGINRFDLYQSIIKYLTKRDKELAKAFWSYIYDANAYPERFEKYYKKQLDNNIGVLSSGQLKELERIIK